MTNLRKTWITAALLGAIAGIMGTKATAAEFVPITTEAEFNALVVGKKLHFNSDYFIIKQNGTLKGNFGGKALKGNWAWRDGAWCRTLTTHRKNTDCQIWAVDGKKFEVKRARGKGSSYIYTVK